MNLLEHTKAHPTADAIYAELREGLPRISLGTVYRNLDVLCRDGLVRKLTMPGGQARWDGNAGPHHHVRCTACGRVDIHSSPELDEEGRNGERFSVTGFNIEFVGAIVSLTTERKLRKHP